MFLEGGGKAVRGGLHVGELGLLSDRLLRDRLLRDRLLSDRLLRERLFLDVLFFDRPFDGLLIGVEVPSTNGLIRALLLRSELIRGLIERLVRVLRSGEIPILGWSLLEVLEAQLVLVFLPDLVAGAVSTGVASAVRVSRTSLQHDGIGQVLEEVVEPAAALLVPGNHLDLPQLLLFLFEDAVDL